MDPWPTFDLVATGCKCNFKAPWFLLSLTIQSGGGGGNNTVENAKITSEIKNAMGIQRKG